MEFVEGLNISEFLKKNPEKLNDVFNQVIEGFKYLEENNILHRDIRPENILISEEGNVKIIDFGFGKQIQFETDNDKSVSLNWRYAIPEEFTNMTYNSKTEVYFIGKLFEEIILENNFENFAYKTTLNKMIERSPLKRSGSFFNIERVMINDSDPRLTFSGKQKETYKVFAESLSDSLSNVGPDIQYISDIDQIISKLKDLHEKCLLEDYVQNTNSLIKCFIKGSFSYYTSKRVPSVQLKNFLDFLKNSPVDKQKIIINNLWGRIDSIPRRDENPPIDVDDIPF
jgi:serine/threonine-protein kinase